MRRRKTVTIPEPGDHFSAPIPVQAIRAYSVGQVPDPVLLASGVFAVAPWAQGDRRVRVESVKIGDEWIAL